MERMYKRVILIGVDGAGRFFAEADTPNMDKIFENGSTTYNAITSLPSISAECWGSMLHGVAPDVHNLTNSIVGSKRFDIKSAYPSFFRVIRENYPEAKLASFCNWNPINYGIIENNLDVYLDSAGDEPLTDRIVDYIKNNEFDTIFVQFDSVDGAGHGNGYGTKGHLDQITLVDGLIGKIYNAIKSRNMLDDTLFMVSADHGGTPQGSHGGDTDAEKIIYIGAAGYNVMHAEMGGESVVSVRDIAAIVLAAMGLDIPDTWDAVVPENLFEGYTPNIKRMSRKPRKHTEMRSKTSGCHDASNIEALLGDGGLRNYFKFDGSVRDVSGTTKPEIVGNLSYIEGRFGKAANFEKGCIRLEKYKIGVDSFTVALWFRIGDVGLMDPVIVSNKDWNSGKNCGFVISANAHGILFNIGDGVNREDCEFSYPNDHNDGDGWMHIVLVVDRKAKKLTCYYDFEEYFTYGIHSTFDNTTFDALDLCIGSDGTAHYGAPLIGDMEDLLIFNRALTAEDVENLRHIYFG